LFLAAVFYGYLDVSVDSYDCLLSVVPVKKYANTDLNKLEILKENKGKSGIYRWINNINGKSYIGSSTKLNARFLQYFNTNYLLKKTVIEKGNSIIYNSILKNGYSNFTLDILEYCTADNCIDKEQYYIDLLKPEYNLLTKAGSWLGYKHTAETLAKMAASHLGKTHTLETRAKIGEAVGGKNHPMFGKPRAIGAGKPSQKILVIDLEKNTETIYISFSKAAAALGIRRTAISTYISRNQQNPFKERYIFKRSSIEGQ